MPECVQCGAEFDPDISESESYCSYECADQAQQSEMTGGALVKPWDFHIPRKYMGGPQNPYQYAVEIEFFRPRSRWRRTDFNFLRPCLGRTLYLKQDSSTNPDCGVGAELNSVFLTLEQHKTYGWQRKLASLVRSGFRSWDTKGEVTTRGEPLSCGLHVRFPIFYGNAQLFDSYPSSRALFFLQKLTYDNPHMWTILGRRDERSTTPERFASIARPSNGICETARFKNQDSKYHAIRITPDSLEFRRFRGSLRYESLMASIECVNAMQVYCERLNAQTAHLCTMPEFFRWVKTMEYPYFKKVFLQRIGEEK